MYYIVFDTTEEVDNTPSLETLLNVECNWGNYSPLQPAFKGWEQKVLEWAFNHVGNYTYMIEVGDTYVSLAYDLDLGSQDPSLDHLEGF